MAKKNKQKKAGKAAPVFEPKVRKANLPQEPPDDEEDDEEETDETDEEAGTVEAEEAREERLNREEPQVKPNLIDLEASTRPVRHPAHDTELSPSDILLASLAMVASGMMTEKAVAEQIRQAFESMKPRQRLAQGSALISFLHKIRNSALQLSVIVDQESKRG